MYGIIQALITYSYERTEDLLYFGDTHILSLHTLVLVYDHSHLGL